MFILVWDFDFIVFIEVLIIVFDVNDYKLVFSLLKYNVIIFEVVGIGSLVLKLIVIDKDSGSNS